MTLKMLALKMLLGTALITTHEVSGISVEVTIMVPAEVLTFLTLLSLMVSEVSKLSKTEANPEATGSSVASRVCPTLESTLLMRMSFVSLFTI